MGSLGTAATSRYYPLMTDTFKTVWRGGACYYDLLLPPSGQLAPYKSAPWDKGEKWVLPLKLFAFENVQLRFS